MCICYYVYGIFTATRRVVFYCMYNEQIASVYSVRSLPSVTTSCTVASILAILAVFLLLRHITICRDIGDTGIVTEVSTISIEVSWVSHKG